MRSDGTVIENGLLTTVTGITAVAAGAGYYGLALKNDGTVLGLGEAVIPGGLSNVTAIAAGGFSRSTPLGFAGFGLAITSEPPLPILAGQGGGQQMEILFPLGVSGFRLEAADQQGGTFHPIDITPTEDATVVVPVEGPMRLFRLRK